jgi:hypothetical protein
VGKMEMSAQQVWAAEAAVLREIASGLPAK